MTLGTGTRLGQYEIITALGEGGMGEVYRSRDTRLGREVAIKVILEAFAADRERLKTSLDLALKMTPLTPDHHFYMDQGTYARVRLVLMAIGRKLVSEGVLSQPDDVMFLRYHELRVLSANF